MDSHFFLFDETLCTERLHWIEESLRFYFTRILPENPIQPIETSHAAFTFFLTGDSLYSIQNPGTTKIWEAIMALPSVQIICDGRELALRGISPGNIPVKSPDKVIIRNKLARNGKPSFWKDVIDSARQHEQPEQNLVGFLHLKSPYMNRSSEALLDCLRAILEAHSSIDLYCYLDGVHIGHHDQKPSEFENVGEGLNSIAERAAEQGLDCRMLACSRCATARGYNSGEDDEGTIVSTCSIRPFRIRNLRETIDCFRRNHIILGNNCASIQLGRDGMPATPSILKRERAPPLTLLITCHPYGTENAFGGLSFAIAAASGGIQTHVVFIEDGVYALAGSHQLDQDSSLFNIQDVIDAVAGSENFQMYCFIPSLQKRGAEKNPDLAGVLDIGVSELGNLLFSEPEGFAASHQRVFFF